MPGKYREMQCMQERARGDHTSRYYERCSILLRGSFVCRSRAREALKHHLIVSMRTGKDFYIALMDHEDWSLGHTAWATIEDLSVVNTILQAPFTDQEHMQYGTHMRMMDNPIHFTLQLTES